MSKSGPKPIQIANIAEIAEKYLADKTLTIKGLAEENNVAEYILRPRLKKYLESQGEEIRSYKPQPHKLAPEVVAADKEAYEAGGGDVLLKELAKKRKVSTQTLSRELKATDTEIVTKGKGGRFKPSQGRKLTDELVVQGYTLLQLPNYDVARIVRELGVASYTTWQKELKGHAKKIEEAAKQDTEVTATDITLPNERKAYWQPGKLYQSLLGISRSATSHQSRRPGIQGFRP